MQQRGFQRVRLNGEVRRLDDRDLIDSKAKEIEVQIVVDRIVLRPDQRSRLADSLDLAFSEGDDRALVLVEDRETGAWREHALSNRLSCVICGTVYEPLTPRHFSWNHAEGACSGVVVSVKHFNFSRSFLSRIRRNLLRMGLSNHGALVPSR